MPRDYQYYSPSDSWVQAAENIGSGFQKGMGMGVENAMLRKNKKEDFAQTLTASGFKKKDPMAKYSNYATEIQAPNGETYVKDLSPGELEDKGIAKKPKLKVYKDKQGDYKPFVVDPKLAETYDIRDVEVMPDKSSLSDQIALIQAKETAKGDLPERKFASAEATKEQKMTESSNMKNEKLDQIVFDTKGTLNTLQNIRGGMQYFGVTGPVPSMWGTTGRTWDANFNKLKSTMVLNIINSMKAVSKTGATGFGQLSEKEGKILSDAATALEKGLPEADAAVILDEIEASLQRILDKSTQAMQEYGSQQGQAGQNMPTFNSEQEIEAANLPDGTEIIFQGKPMRVRY